MTRESPRKLRRRRQYKARIFQSDYFVVKHLAEFLDHKINEYIIEGNLVADIGCGEQPWRSQIEKLGGIYLGIDITQDSQNSIDIIANINQLPLTNKLVDNILCTEVLEHVSNADSAFSEFSRILKPGGHIILTLPFAYPLHEEPYDFWRYTPHQVRICASINNLAVIELQTVGNELEVIAIVWDNLWGKMFGGQLNFFKRSWIALMRLPINIIISITSFLIDKYLPKKNFLNTICILEKNEF